MKITKRNIKIKKDFDIGDEVTIISCEKLHELRESNDETVLHKPRFVDAMNHHCEQKAIIRKKFTSKNNTTNYSLSFRGYDSFYNWSETFFKEYYENN